MNADLILAVALAPPVALVLVGIRLAHRTLVALTALVQLDESPCFHRSRPTAMLPQKPKISALL
jgi:hypothetical protein